jgi:PST family polysaccharide transporter
LILAPEERGALLGTAFGLRLLVAPLAFVAFIWVLSTGPAGRPDFGVIAGVGLTLCSPAILVFDSWFQSQTQARYSVWGQAAGAIIGALLRIGGIALHAPLAWFGWVAGLELLASGIWLAALYRRSRPQPQAWRFTLAFARRLLAHSWSLALTNIAILVYTRIDVVLLARWRDEHDTGVYSVAVRLIELGYLLPMIAVNTLFPVLTRMKAQDPAGFQLLLHRLLAGVAWVGVVTALGLMLTAPVVIPMLYGSAFAAAVPILMLGAWNCVFAGLGAVRAQWLLLNNLQHYGLYYVALGALLSMALNTWLIPTHGALGAAAAGLITQGFIVLIAPLFFAPTRPSVVLLLQAFVLHGVRSHRPNPPPA